MSRLIIRGWKRAVSAGSRSTAEASCADLAKEASLSLLIRSVSFGHGRLAVQRLASAVQLGAAVPSEHWHYCRAVVSKSRDPDLEALLNQAEAASSLPTQV